MAPHDLGDMFFREADQPLDATFTDAEFEKIFLHNQYPGKGGVAKTGGTGDKAEIWALYDAQTHYNGINMLRRLRQLWGIHLNLQIGPRSAANTSPRGILTADRRLKDSRRIFFEGYKGNISDATRSIVTISPYDHGEKSRALSQLFFVRLIVPLKGLTALGKIEALLMAYSVALFLDAKRFAGIVDPDIFLFVPPESVRAGLAHFHRNDRLLNTHLVSGFNFFDSEGRVRFFTHGLSRFGMSELLLSEDKSKPALTSADYTDALKIAHSEFLKYLTAGKTYKSPKQASKVEKLPEQVSAMMGKKIAALKL